MRHACIFISLFFLCSLSVYADKNTSLIKGVVTADTDKPVGYVVVYTDNTPYSTTTNEKGEYSLVLPEGRYQLYFSHINYNNFECSIQLARGEQKTQNVALESTTQSLDELVFSEKTEKKEIETKGFSVSVIEPQKMAVQSIQTNELLNRTAGVRIRQEGGLGSRTNYNINGLSGSSVKVFIDGIPSSNFGSSFSLNSIPPAMIERIEIYKGVVPGYLSEDALGGAINIVLKQKTKNALTTSYSFGSFNTHQWNATSNLRTKNGFTSDVSAFYNYSDNSYRVWGDEITFKKGDGSVEKANQKVKRFHDAYSSYGAKFNVGFTKVKWADRFMLGGLFSSDYKELQHGTTMEIVYGDVHNRRQSNVATLTYAKNNLFTKGLSFKIDASYSHQKKQLIDTVGIKYDWSGRPLTNPKDGSYITYNSGAETRSAKTLALNTDNAFMTRANIGYNITNNHRLYLNYLHNDFVRGITDILQPLGLQKLTNTRDLQKNILSFTYENTAFDDRVRTNLFYKYYAQKVTSNEPLLDSDTKTYHINRFVKNVDYSGFGLTLSWRIHKDLYLLGSAEKAIRLPSEVELFGDNANLLPAELDAEISYNANLGFNWEGVKINEHLFSFNATFVYRNTRGKIQEAINAGKAETSQFENLENVLTRGFDAGITYIYADKLHASFNISKFDALFNTEFDANGARYNYYRMQIRNEPSFKFNANIAYHIDNIFLKKSRLTINYNINFVNKFRRNWANIGGKNLDFIPTQYPNDISLIYMFPKQKISVSFDAKNIFDQQIYDNFGLQKPGRAFYGKITFSII